MGLFYHFTSRIHLPAIEASGFLRTTDSILSADPSAGGPPCVWLLDVPETQGHSHGLTGGIADKTEVRFSVEVPSKNVFHWLTWADSNGIDPQWRDVMVESGGGWEAADHWFCVFRKVPRVQWRAVEFAAGPGEWRSAGVLD
jgi:hypothetical protein